MTWVDVFSLSFLSMFAVIGWLKGLSRQLISWSVWVFGGYTMYSYLHFLAGLPLLSRWVENEWLRNALVVGAMLLMIMLISLIGQRVVRMGVLSLGLSSLDRLFGLFLGAAQAAVLLFFAVVLVDRTDFSTDSWWRQSKLVEVMHRAFPRSASIWAHWAMEGVSVIHQAGNGTLEKVVSANR